MNDEKIKNKLKMQDIINELTNLKEYNDNLFNNVKGDKLENYLNELNKSIIKTQDKAEDIYINFFK